MAPKCRVVDSRPDSSPLVIVNSLLRLVSATNFILACYSTKNSSLATGDKQTRFWRYVNCVFKVVFSEKRNLIIFAEFVLTASHHYFFLKENSTAGTFAESA